MAKKMFYLCLLGVLIAAFSLQTAMAADPNWQAKQKKLLEQTGLKPGEVINASNWQKVQNCLPESIVGYVKKGEFVLKIGEMKYDYANDADWDKAGALNKGKYGLGSRKEIVDKATGKFPTFLYGRPFPEIDKNNPDIGIKIMHNRTVDEARMIHGETPCTTVFIGEKGLERLLWDGVHYSYFWSDLRGERPNPNKFKFMEIVTIDLPYDLAGTVVLTHRPLDGTPDRGGTYVPALRRVRKTSGTNRSDPFFGSDFVNDDAGGWGGQNETMGWKVIGEKVVLMPKPDWGAEHPDIMTKQPNGMWKTQHNVPTQKIGFSDKTWKGAPWYVEDTVWVPREMWLIEATPLDPYYNYGKCVYYVDKDSLTPQYKIISNKAGEHWKTLIINQYNHRWGEGAKNSVFVSQGWYIVVDDKRHHASYCHARGAIEGKPELYADYTLLNPNLTDADFTFEKIATWSK